MVGYYIQQGGGCYNKPLDNATNPKYLGYLQGSSKFPNPEDMQIIINNKLKEMGINEEIGVRLKKVKQSDITGVNIDYNERSWPNKPSWPLQLEGESTDVHKLKKALYNMWNRPKGSRPYHYDYRYVPAPSICRIGESGSDKFANAWKQHCDLLWNIRKIRTLDLRNLDTEINTTTNTTMSLREALMKLNASDGKKLFHAVDKCQKFMDPQFRTKLLSVRKDYYIEAEALLSLLLRKFEVEYGKKSNNWFTGTALNNSSEIRFDEDKGYFITEDNDALDKLLDSRDLIITNQEIVFNENKKDIDTKSVNSNMTMGIFGSDLEMSQKGKNEEDTEYTRKINLESVSDKPNQDNSDEESKDDIKLNNNNNIKHLYNEIFNNFKGKEIGVEDLKDLFQQMMEKNNIPPKEKRNIKERNN